MIEAMTSELDAVMQLVAMLVADPRYGVLIGLLIAAAWSDYGTGRIPNALVFGGTCAGLAYSALMPPVHTPTAQSILLAAAGFGCGIASMLPFYALRVMGAGDVKLMGMCGAFLAYPDIFWAVLATFLAGGLLSLVYLAATGRLRQGLANITGLGFAMTIGQGPAIDAGTSAGSLPYGVAIAVGTIAFLLLRQIGIIH